MTPADQMSIFVVCDVHLNRTSGARKPLVPARFARREGRESFLGYPADWALERMFVCNHMARYLLAVEFWAQWQSSPPRYSR